jgi:hypothetical protein
MELYEPQVAVTMDPHELMFPQPTAAATAAAAAGQAAAERRQLEEDVAALATRVQRDTLRLRRMQAQLASSSGSSSSSSGSSSSGRLPAARQEGETQAGAEAEAEAEAEAVVVFKVGLDESAAQRGLAVSSLPGVRLELAARVVRLLVRPSHALRMALCAPSVRAAGRKKHPTPIATSTSPIV